MLPHRAAVDVDHLSGDIRRLRTGQKSGDRRDVFGGTTSLEWCLAEHPLLPTHVHLDAGHATRVQSLRLSIEASDGAAIELADEIRNIVGDEIDERRRRGDRWRGYAIAGATAAVLDAVRKSETAHGLASAGGTHTRRDGGGRWRGAHARGRIGAAAERRRGIGGAVASQPRPTIH